MRTRRAVLLAIPPLAAELVGRVLAARPDLDIIVAPADARLIDLAPDIIITGDTTRITPDIRAALPNARILRLSADLRWLHGPGDGDAVPLTIANLVERVRGDAI